jgi:hypothetical protein
VPFSLPIHATQAGFEISYAPQLEATRHGNPSMVMEVPKQEQEDVGETRAYAKVEGIGGLVIFKHCAIFED